mgnify:CR=1 FL=1
MDTPVNTSVVTFSGVGRYEAPTPEQQATLNESLPPADTEAEAEEGAEAEAEAAVQAAVQALSSACAAPESGGGATAAASGS